MLKKLNCFVLVTLILLSTLAPITTSAATPQIILNSVEVQNGGYVKIIGQVTPFSNPKQVELAFLAVRDGKSITDSDAIAYVNQYSIGNNGTFLIQFKCGSAFSNAKLNLSFGASDISDPQWTAGYKYTITLKTIPPTINSVVNNSVIYGIDAYTLDSIYLTSEYVADSIATGGNLIYYKLGDYWYDLLDPRCTSSEFLVKDNALTMTFMDTVKLRYYYYKGEKQTFVTE